MWSRQSPGTSEFGRRRPLHRGERQHQAAGFDFGNSPAELARVDVTGKIFDCVIVITDRRELDQQLQDAIYQIEHAQGVVKAIDQDSRQLAAALIDGIKIFITTLQKFPICIA